MNLSKTLVMIIGLFLGSWIMICEPAMCSADKNFIKVAIGFEDSNLLQLAQGPYRIQMGPDNRRRPLDGANSSRSANGLTLESLRNAEYKSTCYGDKSLKNLRAGEKNLTHPEINR